MRRLIYILALAVLVCLGIEGCTPRRVGEAMNRADSLMMSAPDSAIALLDAIDPATLRTDAARARHAVLLTRARHLAYVPVYDDSLIAIGTDYYATHGTHAEKAEAFYMSSVVNNYHQRYEQSIVDGLRAEKHALATSDHLLLGLVYRTIADGFREMYDASSALHYFDLSYRSLRTAKSKKYAPWALIDLSRAYIMINQNDAALIYSSQALDIADSIGNIDLKVAALKEIAEAYFYKRERMQAILYYEKIRDISPMRLQDNDFENLGQSYLLTGNILKARECQDSLDARGYALSGLEIMLREREGNFESAYELQSHVLNWQNREVDRLFNRNYAATISDYYKVEEKRLNDKISSQYRYIAFFGMLLVIALAFYMTVQAYRAKLLRKDIDNHILAAQNLRETLMAREANVRELAAELSDRDNRLSDSAHESGCLKSEIDRLQQVIVGKDAEILEREKLEAASRRDIAELYSSQFTTLDRLCTLYYLNHSLPNEQKRIAEEITGIVEDMSSDKKLMGRLEANINNYMNNIMVDFRKDFPRLHAWEYSIFILLLLRFSTYSICVLLNIRPDTFYNRKSALRKKILKSENSSKYMSFI